jgi:hypothetical protein
MKSGLLLFVIAVSAAAVGYLELRHQNERSIWQTEKSDLTTRLEHAERQAMDYASSLASIDQRRRDEQASSARLAELKGQILDAAADLARLESDRTVASQRADAALGDLKEQVRSLSTIEIDVAALDKRRGQLVRQVETVEERLQDAEIGAAERQKRAEELDRDIAGLAIRKETLLANLKAVEREKAEDALAEVVALVEKDAEPTSPTAPEKPAQQAVADIPSPSESLPLSAEEDDGEKTRGLYQFSSLSLDEGIPATEDSEGGKGGLPPQSSGSETGADDKAGAANWAEDQYLLGLRLVSSAEQSSSTRELNEAVLAFKAVLAEWPKDRDPMRWAIAQSDLGYAMALLGKRRDDVGLLEKAAEACGDALSVLTPNKAPLLWAAAQHYLGVSLGGLADLQGDQDVKLASIEALTLAVDAFKREGAETDAKKAELRLRQAYADLPKTQADGQ